MVPLPCAAIGSGSLGSLEVSGGVGGNPHSAAEKRPVGQWRLLAVEEGCAKPHPRNAPGLSLQSSIFTCN